MSIVGLLGLSAPASRAQVPYLGILDTFAAYTAAGAVSNTGSLTTVNGNLGTNAGAVTGLGGAPAGGTVYGVTYNNDTKTQQAYTAVNALYLDLSTRPSPAANLLISLNGAMPNPPITLTSGVYHTGGAAEVSGSLVLDAKNDVTALFIFQIGGALTSSGGTVTLVNGASAKNVFWQVNGAAAMATPTSFVGTIVANGAVSFGDGVTVQGAGFSIAGAIGLYNNTLTANSSPAPLPVELMQFTATATAHGLVLGWATASEKNNDRFEVQRSADGRGFDQLGTVPGQGTSTRPHTYNFIDSHPLPGRAYYRLRQVDTDGAVTFSSIVSARWQPVGPMVYPSPGSGALTLLDSSGPVQYRLFNSRGQTVEQGNSVDRQLLLVPHPMGVYLLELTNSDGRSVQRVVRE